MCLSTCYPIEMGTEFVIEAHKLTKRFGSFTAVDAISFDVRHGEVFGFLGANGAGKTTAIKMLCALSRPTAGTATVAGYDIARQGEQVKRRIGYMSQKFSLYNDLTVQENITLFGGIYGLTRRQIAQRSDHLYDTLELKEYERQLVGALPLGIKQRLAFSVATIHRPEIVFLDEPTGGVDPIARRQFWELIYRATTEGTTAFVTTHYMDEAEYCDRLSIMVDGCIKAIGTPSELKKEFNANTMDEVFRHLARGAARSE